jgi:hypothetical protein
MNPPLIKPLLFVLAFATPALADFTQADSAKASANCNGGSFLSTTVFDKDIGNARAKAKAEIAQNIIFNIKSSTKTKDYSEEKDGVMREFSKFSEKSKIESNLVLSGFREIDSPKQQENDEYEAKAYICRSDAAKPWLASFEAEVAKYSNLAIKIAEEKDSQKRNELLSVAASVKDSANWADIVLSSIINSSTNEEYARLKEEFNEAKKKIELATKRVYDEHYSVFMLPLLPPGGWAQFYKGHYIRAAMILGSQAVLLGTGGISYWVSYKDADRKYKDAVLKHNSSKNLNEKNKWLNKSKEYKSDRESAENTVYAAFLLTGVVYAYSIVDGYASTPTMPRWHWAAMPIPSRSGNGVAFALTGNF